MWDYSVTFLDSLVIFFLSAVIICLFENGGGKLSSSFISNSVLVHFHCAGINKLHTSYVLARSSPHWEFSHLVSFIMV